MTKNKHQLCYAGYQTRCNNNLALKELANGNGYFTVNENSKISMICDIRQHIFI